MTRSRLQSVLAKLDAVKVRSAIGDSNNTNRALSVSQVIRYASSRRNSAAKAFGKQLSKFYSSGIKSALLTSRAIYGLNRTDAYDVSELLAVMV